MPYEEANIPQAWAAATPLLAAQLFLGLIPDAPRGRCFVSPWLPAWLPTLEVRGIRIEPGMLDITVVRRGSVTTIEHTAQKDLEVIDGTVEAPLLGRPPSTVSATRPASAQREHDPRHGA